MKNVVFSCLLSFEQDPEKKMTVEGIVQLKTEGGENFPQSSKPIL